MTDEEKRNLERKIKRVIEASNAAIEVAERAIERINRRQRWLWWTNFLIGLVCLVSGLFCVFAVLLAFYTREVNWWTYFNCVIGPVNLYLGWKHYHLRND